jgi:hypothetical protein
MEEMEMELSQFSLTKLMVNIQIILILSEEMDTREKTLTLIIKQTEIYQ